MQTPICEHPLADRQRLFPARDYVTGDQFEIVRCGACGLALTWPPPGPSEMGKYYPAVYYASTGGKRFPALVELLQKFLYGRRVQRIERLLKKQNEPPLPSPLLPEREERENPRALRGRVLDVGCGPGFLLRQFQAHGWEVQGTELSEQSAAHARKTLGLPIHV